MLWNTLQLILGILLILVILMQGRGAGLGEVFGGTANVYSAKRGAEKTLHYATIVLAIAFFVIALINVLY